MSANEQCRGWRVGTAVAMLVSFLDLSGQDELQTMRARLGIFDMTTTGGGELVAGAESTDVTGEEAKTATATGIGPAAADCSSTGGCLNVSNNYGPAGTITISNIVPRLSDQGEHQPSPRSICWPPTGFAHHF